MEISEAGIIALVGMLFGFLIACCKQIEQSRCTNIDVCGLKCSREPLKDDTIMQLDKQSEVEMPDLDHSNHRQNPLAPIN